MNRTLLAKPACIKPTVCSSPFPAASQSQYNECVQQYSNVKDQMFPLTNCLYPPHPNSPVQSYMPQNHHHNINQLLVNEVLPWYDISDKDLEYTHECARECQNVYGHKKKRTSKTNNQPYTKENVSNRYSSLADSK